ncbi:transposase [Streptomyces sp. WAC 01529]|uniref:NF041680 family putative transposase n=1 Tax=Streptomyces sp. WAC 01529 TaxID=2203205 RepID=UPI000F6FC679|nr:NF041680 family putative transposase [Streptomyces sp. WAC 01529]AZM51247.1 transposase [Streptomyces sp. WAC 01529]
MSLLHHDVRQEAFAQASCFRSEFYKSLTARRDELFELTDALLCVDGPVTSPVELTLIPEHRRGHGALYGALNRGRIDVERLQTLLVGMPLPRFDGGRLVLAVDVSPWLRSDAPCSADDRLFCHVYGRAKSASQFIPGWPYSFVAALEPGATSWTSILDVVRLGPEDDATGITAAQLRAVVERLIAAGQWTPGAPDITIVMDAGYDVTRLAWVLRDLPVELVGRIRGDRVMRLPKPSLKEYALAYPQGGRPPKHGKEFRFNKPEAWPEPAITTATDTMNYGKAEAQAWHRVHPRLTHRSAWLDHDGELPIVEGTLVRLKVEHLSKEREAPPVWLWSSQTGAAPADVDRWWQGFLRRFDLEHTFKFAKQTLGWTTPKLRTLEAADRWTWLLAVAHTQLRLARPLAADLRRPWEEPVRPERLTPARVRRGFRNIRAHLLCPARVPQPCGAGPRRPLGTKNRHPAPRYDVGKTVKRPETLKAIGRSGRS